MAGKGVTTRLVKLLAPDKCMECGKRLSKGELVVEMLLTKHYPYAVQALFDRRCAKDIGGDMALEITRV